MVLLLCTTSRMRRNATREPILTKFCTVVGIPHRITYTYFGDHRLRGFGVAGSNFLFSHMLSLSPLQHSHYRACGPKIASVWSADHLPNRSSVHGPEAHAGGFTLDPHFHNASSTTSQPSQTWLWTFCHTIWEVFTVVLVWFMNSVTNTLSLLSRNIG